MSKPEIPLTDDEVRRIGRIIETLEHSSFDYLQLELGDLRVTVARDGVVLPGVVAAAPAPSPAPAAVTAPTPAAAAPVAAPASAPAAGSAVEPAPEPGLVDIVSPMIGRFYSQPEPGAAPYVTVGARVDPDATVCLVEAMKMFNAVHAGVSGTIAQVCAQDASLVEYGQVLFRVRPA